MRERHTEWRTGQVELQTELAKSESAKANAEAGRAQASIAESNKEIIIARTEAAKASAETAKAHARIAELQTESDNARAAIADANARALEAKVALEKFRTPRTFTPAQQKRIVEKLKLFAGQKFDLAVQIGDIESQKFALKIEEILKLSYWIQVDWQEKLAGGQVYGRVGGHDIGQTTAGGVIVEIHPDHIREFKSAADALVDILMKEGFDAGAVMNSLENTNAANTSVIHVIVGKKS